MIENLEIEKIAMDWIFINSSFENDNKFDDEIFFDGQKLVDFSFSDPETSWKIIKYIVANNEDKIILSNLAAGPLETLLSAHGLHFIDRVESLAKSDERFRWTLGGVWQCLMPDSVWNKIFTLTKDVRER